MAQKGQKDLLTRLADAGEDAIQRLAGTPGADRVLGVVTNMRDQLDALSKRVRGMEGLERRVEELERQVAKLQKGGASSRTTTTRRTTAAKKTATTRRAAGSRSRPSKKQ